MDREALFADIQIQLDAGVAWLQSHFPGLEVETQLVDGSPVDILVEASRHVELVVVGTRGRGGFAGMLLGSTSDGVLHHAKGPVMVVPDRDDPRLADRASFGPMLGDSYVPRYGSTPEGRSAHGAPPRPDPAQDGPVLALERLGQDMLAEVGGKAANLGELIARRPAGSRRLLPDHRGLPGGHGLPGAGRSAPRPCRDRTR